MKKISLLLIISLSLLLFIPSIEAAPPQDGTAQEVTVQVLPGNEIQQGRTAMVRVNGINISRAEATFLGQFVTLHRTLDGDWMGLVGVEMDTAQGVHQLNVYTWHGDDTENIRTSLDLTVVWGGFPSEALSISYGLSDLLDPELNQWETDLLLEAYSRKTKERFYTNFIPPSTGPIISSFGNFRTYNNDQLRGRHTGIDYRVNTDTPITATAHGRVILARRLPIHGNHIIIDHGRGVLSGYSHLNSIEVVPGQLVRQGQVIGLVGSTGRSQGPHLHFEIAVNGRWIDPSQFLLLNLPPINPTEIYGQQ